ncbi:sensor histidine kinase [Steroidobacter agaridevorans]|nr:HAMP domain-containing sensor histidine kinase [Steroidobacter agaridevorans]
MAARLYLILCAGLLVAHALSASLMLYERYLSARSMLWSNLEHDVSTAVALLDRLPEEQRADWLPRLERRTYRYILGAGEVNDQPLDEVGRGMTQMIVSSLGDRYPVTANSTSQDPYRFQAHTQLSDGSPLTIEVTPSVMPIAKWLPTVLGAQVVLLLACAWIAVRLVTRPLADLARAAESISPSGGGQYLKEGGPTEVAHAAAAFNAMQDRIARYLRERMQILASISHDLQTPITRMSLRAEALQDSNERSKLLEDLGEMQHLVREGVAYARSSHGATEPPVNVDLNAFLDSLVYDYQDMGKQVTLTGKVDEPVNTRPHALRRVIGNLLDNAIKYAGAGEIEIRRTEGGIAIGVLDRGPGIPEDQLEAALQPFYRLERSRSRETGGAGLGLAIAQQLAIAIGATLELSNRVGGGLQAMLLLPAKLPGL